MGALAQISGQMKQYPVFDLSGTITLGGTPQLIIPISYTRSSLIIQNISANNMYIEFGGARATATLTSGAVTSCTITNAGFNYTLAPQVVFFGGGNTGNNLNNSSFLGAGLPDYPAPSNIASGHCVMTGSGSNKNVSSIVIDNPGSGYVTAPYVYLLNSPLDPFGCANPFAGSVASGVELLPQGSVTFDGSVCTTDQVAVYCATTASGFTAKFTL